MNLKVLSWNLKYKKHNSEQIKLLSNIDADIFLLQEVHTDFFSNLKNTGLFNWSTFSLDHRPPKPEEGLKRSFGCAILGKNGKLLESNLLETVKFPERTLITKVELESIVFTFCSFHIPPGASWKQIKPETMIKISEWLKDKKENTIFGIDANTPKSDHPNYGKNEWWWKDEPILMGNRPLHELKDVYRIYLKQHPEIYEKIIKNRPEGPLAISYKRGSRTKVPCRYDFIYATKDLEPIFVDYCYDKATKAGSDHAIVIAELVLEKGKFL